MSIPRAPADLGAAGRRLWRSVLAEFDLSEDSLTLLRQACHVADQCEALQRLAAEQPPVILSRLGGPMANPVHTELRAERRMLLAFLYALREPIAEPDPVPAARPGALRVVT